MVKKHQWTSSHQVVFWPPSAWKQPGQATGRITTMCLELFQNRGTTGPEEKLETVIYVPNIEVMTNGKTEFGLSFLLYSLILFHL